MSEFLEERSEHAASQVDAHNAQSGDVPNVRIVSGSRTATNTTTIESSVAKGDSGVLKAIHVVQRMIELRWFLLRVMVCGLVLSVALALLIPKRYEATAMMVPPQGQSNLSTLAASAGGVGALGLGMLRTPGAYYTQLLNTDEVTNALIDRFDLRKVYDVRLYVTARKKLASRTTISEDKLSEVIQIQVTDSDPLRAAALANAYVEELNRKLASLNTSSAHRERVFLEERLRDIKVDLDAVAQQLSQYSSTTGTLNVEEQGKSLLESSAKLGDELIASESELKALQQIYATDNPRVRSAQARVNELERSFQEMDGNSGQNNTGNQSINLRQLPVLAVKFQDLYMHYQLEEKAYATLNEHYELAKVDEAKELPVVSLVDRATPPERHSYPPRTLIVVVGTLFSFVLGALWIVAVELWQGADQSNSHKRTVIAILAAFRHGRSSEYSPVSSE